jgi:hypothetical protein
MFVGCIYYESYYIYDNANFKSKMLCKIINSEGPINLLLKTGMEYYNGIKFVKMPGAT